MFEIYKSNTVATLGPVAAATLRDLHDARVWRDECFVKSLEKGIVHHLALRNGSVEGFISYRMTEGGRSVYLHEFQIAPGSQANGVTFRRLVAYVMKDISRTSYESLLTFASGLNKRSQALSEKVGFERKSATAKGVEYRITRQRVEAMFGRFSAD
jgi:hypothetical protein